MEEKTKQWRKVTPKPMHTLYGNKHETHIHCTIQYNERCANQSNQNYCLYTNTREYRQEIEWGRAGDETRRNTIQITQNDYNAHQNVQLFYLNKFHGPRIFKTHNRNYCESSVLVLFNCLFRFLLFFSNQNGLRWFALAAFVHIHFVQHNFSDQWFYIYSRS